MKRAATGVLCLLLLLGGCIQPEPEQLNADSLETEEVETAASDLEETIVEAEMENTHPVIEREEQKPEPDPDNEGLEIERKFLIDARNLPAHMERTAYRFDFVQTYINYSPEIRLRHYDGRYFFTLKRSVDDGGLVREEIQFQLSGEEYNELLQKQVGNTIYKARYQFYEGETYVFVDVYGDALEGLVVAEVEFGSVADAEAFVPPAWFGKEITDDKRYKNASLSRDGLPDPA